jgi:hypothetical protein
MAGGLSQAACAASGVLASAPPDGGLEFGRHFPHVRPTLGWNMWIIVRSFSAGAPHRNSMLRAAFGGRISLFAWPRGQGWGNREDAAALPSVMTIESGHEAGQWPSVCYTTRERT